APREARRPRHQPRHDRQGGGRVDSDRLQALPLGRVDPPRLYGAGRRPGAGRPRREPLRGPETAARAGPDARAGDVPAPRILCPLAALERLGCRGLPRRPGLPGPGARAAPRPGAARADRPGPPRPFEGLGPARVRAPGVLDLESPHRKRKHLGSGGGRRGRRHPSSEPVSAILKGDVMAAPTTRVDEIADGIYRISTPTDVVPGGFTFNQYLIRDDEPLLFHTGMRATFPLIKEAIGRVMPVEKLRWVSFSHVEADECGALNQFLAVAPQAQPLCSRMAAMTSVNDMADRPPRVVVDGEIVKLGRHSIQWHDTPHLPHS